MAATDHAILVGIERYPQLGENNTALNVKSANPDVDLVDAWLRDAAGGDVPDANITRILSKDYPQDGLPRPANSDLDAVLLALNEKAQAQIEAGKGVRLGRRLYIYMSGHGFSPRQRIGCVYTADAHPNLGQHVNASSWLNAMQDAGYFNEVVLWLDCCMNRVSKAVVTETLLREFSSGAPTGPSFVAFGAQRPLKAAEILAPNGDKHHGAFTWALVEGLRGAAVNVNGHVTGRSLADWLRNAQGAMLSAGDRNDPEVSKRPQIVQEDPGLIFARGVTSRNYDIVLTFPAGLEGEQMTLLAGAPPTILHTRKIAADGVTLALAPGLYVVEAGDRRHGIEVVAPARFAISHHAPATPAPPKPSICNVRFSAHDATTEIVVVNRQFEFVDSGVGRLETSLPTGIYKVTRRSGRDETAEVVLIDRDGPVRSEAAEPPPRTIAPIPGSALTHDYHISGANQARKQASKIDLGPDDASLTFVTRVWSADKKTTPDILPWAGVVLLDSAGQLMVDLTELTPSQREDPIAWRSFKLPAGLYYLRQPNSDLGPIEQCIHLSAGWRTEVQILWEVTAQRTLSTRPRIALSMWQRNVDPRSRRVSELARVALADERPILGDELEMLLLHKWSDPLAGIVGGHLLILESERNGLRDLTLLNIVVRNLQQLLGETHPDVAALSLKCPDPKLHTNAMISGPPMFARSWSLLLLDDKIIPPETWARASSRLSTGPYLTWSSDETTRQRVFQQLDQVLETEILAPIQIAKPFRAFWADFELGAISDLQSMQPSSKVRFESRVPDSARTYLRGRREE